MSPHALLASLALALVLVSGRPTPRTDTPSAPEEYDSFIDALLGWLQEVQQRHLGPGDPALADTLQDRAVLALKDADYPRALALHERALAIREAAFGPDPVAVAKSLDGLGAVVLEMGDYDRARRCFERARSILEKAREEEPDVAASIEGHLARLDLELGDYTAARSRLEEALARFEQARGSDDPSVASFANNLGVAMYRAGDLAAARARYEQALRIREKAFGAWDARLVIPLNNLGAVLEELDDQAGARAAFERAHRVGEETLRPDHPLRAESLHSLAHLLRAQGDSARARSLIERSLALREKVLGRGHPALVGDLTLLGEIRADLGGAGAGARLLERAIRTAEQALGAVNPAVATPLLALGRLKLDTGDHAAALPLLERSLAIRERSLGPDHIELAEVLDALAEAYRRAGRPDRARPLLERALAIRRRHLGARHPDLIGSLILVAALQADGGDRASAFSTALGAEAIAREHFRLAIRTLGERQALLYTRTRARGLDLALSLLSREARRDPGEVREALDAVIRSRSLVLDEMARRQRSAARTDDEEVRALARDLSQARSRLAHLAVRGPGGERLDHYRRLLEGARAQKEAAERALAERSVSFREEQARDQAGLEAVRAALPSGSALLGYVRYDDHEHGSVPSYAAFVVRPEGGDRLVALGRADRIDALVGGWRAELLKEGRSGGRSRRRNLASYRAAGEALRRRVWDPVAPALTGSTIVYVTPDGTLNLVSLIALPSGPHRYLAEDGPTLHVLSAERDLVPEGAPSGRGLLAAGDPDFQRTPSKHRAASDPGVARTADADRRGERARIEGDCDSLPSFGFRPLPHSAQEVTEVAALWRELEPSDGDALTLSRGAATEGAVRCLAPGRRIVHLATHGFFLRDRCGNGTSSALLRSGLALAGANQRAKSTPGQEDGVLTAEEAASLDLAGVEWAVLSGCDTGMGDVESGDGVFGLRRAFQVAGAHVVIMSLWPVDDESAQLFMRGLYTARFASGQSTPEAVRRASLEVLRARRARGESEHPFYWAAFVATGLDR
jgi:CHAT domain-containing protein/tetratricopeptide (TPR) repeat protein